MIGELGLDGRVRKVPGILPVVMGAREAVIPVCILPEANGTEGAFVDGIGIIGVSHLSQAVAFLSGIRSVEALPPSNSEHGCSGQEYLDYSDVHGQEAVKRAAEVAAAGGHNLLLVGHPEAGNLSWRNGFPVSSPPLTMEESMEITTVYSIMGLVDKDTPLITRRPFRRFIIRRQRLL